MMLDNDVLNDGACYSVITKHSSVLLCSLLKDIQLCACKVCTCVWGGPSYLIHTCTTHTHMHSVLWLALAGQHASSPLPWWSRVQTIFPTTHLTVCPPTAWLEDREEGGRCKEGRGWEGGRGKEGRG